MYDFLLSANVSICLYHIRVIWCWTWRKSWPWSHSRSLELDRSHMCSNLSYILTAAISCITSKIKRDIGRMSLFFSYRFLRSNRLAAGRRLRTFSRCLFLQLTLTYQPDFVRSSLLSLSSLALQTDGQTNRQTDRRKNYLNCGSFTT